ncbi:hypothetical protein M407DRAFT_32327 [Tulasnella calospora MUT 4182]|uniref:Uncharacterized protein n=1 Tax=Tulasnella calospora MUT 4182 TaxID=1051891 RepID=A0A0C3K9C8_9AGAM|nr:hypothetical protein M407DRAFT_32327 [Tulasnella calospora MUT 4182]
MAQAFSPCIALLSQPSNHDCTRRAEKTCLWGFCDYCCINSGYQLLHMCPCPSPQHRIRPNDEPYFTPDHSVAHFRRIDDSTIRIVSPLTGNLECAAGLAWTNMVAGNWREVQELLLEQAEHRLCAEGITIFICIWSMEDTAPAIYIRVLVRGRAWSLVDDRGLLEQMKWIPGSEVDWFDHREKQWFPCGIAQRFEFSTVGFTLYLRKPGVVCTPLLHTLRKRMLRPIPLPKRENTILHYFSPKKESKLFN